MKRFHSLVAALVLCSIPLLEANAQTTGKQPSTVGVLTFTVKTVSNGLGYSPKHVLSIWIKDSAGTFVVSRKVMAGTRKKHLVKWVANSANNVATAITGATLTSHQTHTITWDGTDAAGQMVPDGLYQVWVEYTSQNSANGQPAGPNTSVLFHKGAVADHQAPQNQTYFQNIMLDWVPSSVGKDEIPASGSIISIFPNPFSKETTVKLTLEKPSHVMASVYNSSGIRVSDLIDESCSSGMYSFSWDGTSDNGTVLGSGIYFLNMSINGKSSAHKIILQR
jgi:flagellar hook assembly protein FlgD